MPQPAAAQQIFLGDRWCLPPSPSALVPIRSLTLNCCSQTPAILEANAKDLTWAKENHISSALQGRLKLTKDKLRTVAEGLRQIAAQSHENLGRVVRRMQLADGLLLEKETVPLGVLLVIFESRPDVLPQVSVCDVSLHPIPVSRLGASRPTIAPQADAWKGGSQGCWEVVSGHGCQMGRHVQNFWFDVASGLMFCFKLLALCPH